MHRNRKLILAIVLAVRAATAAAQPSAQQPDADTLFNQGVDAYKQNQFTQATAKFQQVTGPHTQEAQRYIHNMKAYREAIDVAKSAIDRSPNERDANSLAFAMQQLEFAIQIKSDGPWDPNGLLARARDLRTQIEKKEEERSKALDSDFCARATAAAEQHHYADAARFICTVAGDNPAYSCGGDEAVHLCQVDEELVKIDQNAASEPPARSETPAHPPALEQAIAAYDQNDFDGARNLFAHVDAASKPVADSYLDKISRYTDAIAAGEKLAAESQYEPAQVSFLNAANIKPDGPGDPKAHAFAMELLLGVDQFYAGDYISAIRHLQDCARAGTEKQPLVHFYLGASELARFFVTGSEDAALHQDALNDLKLARQAGFSSTGQEVSPKILKVYNDLSF